ncbi:hypothetical protein J7T55_002733 [Diaporthe amygdali]|uniref:uncharacterized protein n=1 Tax=Phomopsis amygdali TaxID=1214568 RepID=UPI0022FED277|nr:uncharacterized protein J7T55_002733 [Diaporthe amygdali]KAJ0122221.1 hypothetical protein J7T55_002733 [Diaporthe amygdali]
MTELQDTICLLCSAARSVPHTGLDPHLADGLNNNFSDSSGTRFAPHEDALFLVLLSIENNIGECLELLRILARRTNITTQEQLTHSTTAGTSSAPRASSTIPCLRREDAAIGSHGPLHTPPIPGLYRDQWAQSPTVSPPASMAFCQSCPRSFPRSLASSPASEMRPPHTSNPTTDDPEATARDGQYAARVDSDSEDGGWLDNGPESHLGGARSRWG